MAKELKSISVDELKRYRKQVTSSKKEASNFLIRVGVCAKDGTISKAYRKTTNVSYRYSK